MAKKKTRLRKKKPSGAKKKTHRRKLRIDTGSTGPRLKRP